jgi:ribosome-binding protein aMBF1 (putative translation factor)
MLVRKCDVCAKEIEGRNKEIVAGIDFATLSFCKECGKPIIDFLREQKLLRPSQLAAFLDAAHPGAMMAT